MDGNNIETKNRGPGNGPRVYCQFLVFQDWANTAPVVAAVVPIHEPAALVEEQTIREVCIAPVRSRAPVAAVLTTAAEHITAAIASRGKEDAVTIWACYLITVLAVLGRPCPGAGVY